MPLQISKSFIRIAELSITYQRAGEYSPVFGRIHYAKVYSFAPVVDIQPQSHWSLTRNMAPSLGSVRPRAGEAAGWDLAGVHTPSL